MHVAQVHVPPHPLVGHWLATLRSDMTPTPVFRSAMAELGRLLVYEARLCIILPTLWHCCSPQMAIAACGDGH